MVESWEDKIKRLTGDYGLVFDCKAEGDNHIDLCLQYLCRRIPELDERSFLDVGCGSKAELSDKLGCWNGIDLMEPEKPFEGNYVVGDCHKLPYRKESFDTIFISHTLEHLLSPLIALDEARRVLKKDGDLIVGVPKDPYFMGPDHNYILTTKGWIHLLSQAGFTEIDYEEVSGCLNIHAKKTSYVADKGQEKIK